MKDNRTEKKKIFLTGGHYTPAKAVLDELIKLPNWKIYYVGLQHSFEGDRGISYEYLELKNHSQVKFLSITTGRVQRKFTKFTIPALLKVPLGFVQSLIWILRFSPDVILSFGGFVAVPVVLAGWFLDVPIITHEQTTAFGLANKFIQLFAQKVMVSFPSTIPVKNREKWVFTGNPIRKEIEKTNSDEEIKSLSETKQKLKLHAVYVTGGKHGSHIINLTIASNLEALLKKSVLVVQTGDNQQFKDYEYFEKAVGKLPASFRKRIIVRKFFDGEVIGSTYRIADLVVGRAGANTIFDLAYLGKPAILIPIPWSSGNEQFKNAKELEYFGGAVILEQDKIDKLPEIIIDSLDKIETYRRKAIQAKDLVVSDSAAQILAIIKSTAL